VESSWTQDLLNWMSANPGSAGMLILVISFLESVAIVGILLPGILMLFGIGALIGLGVLEFGPVWLASTVGAFAGDTMSFGVGYRFREHLTERWPFRRYPAMLERGKAFFSAHGAKSVVAGRFIGPLRPVIPVTAGIMGMKPGRFMGVDLAASLMWSPAYLLPGMLFGASLEVASEYAGRLALVLIITAVVLWMTWWLIWAAYAYLAGHSARWLRRAIRWARRHPWLGRITGPVLDPAQPEVLSVTMLGLSLVLTFWVLILLLFLSPFGAQPQALDQAVHEQALALRNHLADPVMVALSQLSHWWVLVPASAALLLWLLGANHKKAAVHWLVAMGGGMMLQLLLGWTLRTTPLMQGPTDPVVQSPSAALTLASVVFGFFSVMVAKELRRQHRKWPYLVSSLLLTLLLLARLYLGLDWFSGALMGLMLGLAWTAIVGIAYRQRAQRPFSGAIASMIFFTTLGLATTWFVSERLDRELETLAVPLPQHQLDVMKWWETDWRTLPAERTQLSTVATRKFNLQLSVESAVLESDLKNDGWVLALPANWQWVLRSLDPDPNVSSLPPLAKDYLGYAEIAVFHKPGSDDQTQMTLRVWRTGTSLRPGNRPLYVGLLSEEYLVQRLKLFSYWRARPVSESDLHALANTLSGLERKFALPDLLLLKDPTPAE
jgi:membrane protein DedA with SNARE-associated domain